MKLHVHVLKQTLSKNTAGVGTSLP